jgi:hypothetical protein
MEKRQDRYVGDDTTPKKMSRVQKNQSLYNEINNKIGYEEITSFDNGAEIDLSTLTANRPSREEYQKIKDYKNLLEEEPQKKEEINYKREIKTKTFDINEALEEAKRNRKTEDELEKKRNLAENENVLSSLNKKYLHNKDFKEEDSDELKELINTITSKTLVDDIKDEEEKELLSDLLATTIDIKLEQELSTEEINKLYDDKKAINDKMNEEDMDTATIDTDTIDTEKLDNSFFTHSVELRKEDLEDDGKDEDDEDEDIDDEENSGIIKIVVVVAIILALILLITYFILHQMGFSLG